MKLLSIRLHPFGGTANRTCTLHEGINVLEGPNEFGKSTLSNALWHGLFTPTNLTPASLLRTMGRWYPKPGGDHARITIRFHADGQTWTLQKTWGAGASSSLEADGAAGIADPARVQAELLTLLRRNEATWKHVLFTGQAQLAATMEQLHASSKNIDDVQSLLAGPAAIPGDIPPDKLTAALDARITKHFGRWDISANGPERGRGIDNPFSNGKGPLVEAYYAMETVRRDLKDVRGYEEQVDEVNTKINGLQSKIEVDSDFVTTGRRLKDGLASRGGLEEKIQRLGGEQTALKAVLVDWPGADKVIGGKKAELEGVKTTLEALADELKSAKKRADAKQLKLAHGKLVEAREAWNAEATKLSESKAVSADLLAELKRLEKDISDFRIKIEAQKLSTKIESTIPTSVMIVRGTDAPEILTLTAAEAWEGQADGKLIVESRDMKISVASGTGDMDALFEQLKAVIQRRLETLETLGHESLSLAEAADINHQRCVRDEKHKKELYAAALLGRSEEEWEVEIAALELLPDTRSVATLETEQATAVRNEATLTFAIQKEEEKIVKWKTEHTDLDTLMTKILVKTGELNAAKQELAGLPELPEGFASIPEYLRLLRQKESAREQSDQQLNELKIKQGALERTAPDTTAEELRAELEIKQRKFERRQADGQALLRILAKLQAVIAERGLDDPMQGLAAAVSNHFRNLTGGRYQEVTLDGTAPTRVGGALTLETNLLSQGTLGSLALATRLALSELYLKDMGGFFLLDDPFTDMDATRRAAAIQAIGTFAAKHQVLFFTCHPDHAGELQDLTGAQSLLVMD